MAAPDRAQEQRRIAEVFGDLLPATTTDERPEPESGDVDSAERWLRDNRPPHHDPA